MTVALAFLQFGSFFATAYCATLFGRRLAEGTHLDQLFYGSLVICFALLTVFSKWILHLTDNLEYRQEESECK